VNSILKSRGEYQINLYGGGSATNTTELIAQNERLLLVVPLTVAQLHVSMALREHIMSRNGYTLVYSRMGLIRIQKRIITLWNFRIFCIYSRNIKGMCGIIVRVILGNANPVNCTSKVTLPCEECWGMAYIIRGNYESKRYQSKTLEKA